MPFQYTTRLFILFFWAFIFSPIFADEIAPEPTGVTIADKLDRVTLSNGIISAEIDKSTGNILAVVYQGTSVLASPAYLNWHAGDEDTDFKDHQSTYGKIKAGRFNVVVDPKTNNGESAEVSITQTPSDASQPFGLELHYVLRRGVSGLYAFVVFSHEQGRPGGEISQIRWLFRLKDDVFDFMAIDDQRRRAMPPSNTPTKALGPKESLIVTAGPFTGTMVDKYHDFADAGEHFVHGWLGREKQIGCWIVSASTEDQNGGPTKQYNTAHFGRILMKIFSCSHYGAGNVAVGSEEWRKIYGPCLLYFNSGKNADGLWADAKAKAEAERSAWPFAWMRHPLYPLAADRVLVSGNLILNDPQDPSASPANAWVGLAAPAPDWQQQSNNYQYWVRADSEGGFTIPNVRPGNYTLYAFVDGVLDEFRRDNVVVTKTQNLALPPLAWTPRRHGRQLWQIGTPDRTAKEYRHGDDYRQWGLWLRYPKEFPNDVNFVIGQSHERTDWNYAQVNVGQGKSAIGTKWTVSFDLAAPPKRGTAVLSIALAAATKADLEIVMNGRTIGQIKTGHDSAMVRAGIHGQYSLTQIRFNATLFKKGKNQLTLTQRAGGSLQKCVMYDCLRLEVDETSTSK